ncbi:Muramoyltetrapeptide carboxypeptidase [Micrococcus lylae]|uniref:Muramoyltetrapeptide carboxypeptidase n=1 Tax=Micrococcus lylae TaxID=1273 RepID=A0A1R4JM10_9MICC|nr:LD-carboxypeptidase [Micrococcus lylae]SJN33027.1 Muramoyltetrapeptide carboxypeptidase [Micrococcus lylae]
MSPLRFPAPLRPGDRIGVTAPSAGVGEGARRRFEVAVSWLTARGFEVVLGDCLGVDRWVSAPRGQRAAEFTAMLCDPQIRAVVPPWGGPGTALDLLDELDWDAIGAAEPTWVVGYSDCVALMVPLTLYAGLPTLHGDNLMDTPYEVPAGLAHWTRLATAEGGPGGRRIVQRDSGVQGFWAPLEDAHAHAWRDQRAASWELWAPCAASGERLPDDGASPRLDVTGTLLGGCIEVLSAIAGTPYADVRAFAREHGPLVVYVEAAEADASTVCRQLHTLRLHGWFEQAAAVLVGRTLAPDSGSGTEGMTQREAVLDALAGVTGADGGPVPVVFDVEIGHVPPHLPLLNGARARVQVDEMRHVITQFW